MALQLRQNLDVRMEQKLRLTPQMIQSIEILLLPQLALEERIMDEVESNPVLEIEDAPPHEEAGDPLEAETGDELERRRDLDHEVYSDWLKSRRDSRAGDEDAPDRMEAIEATAGPPPSLADHLDEQLRFAELTPEQLDAARHICWQLDDRGYLQEPLEELFEEDRLEDAEVAWEAVRCCEPIGVGARDLRECLLMQLAREPGDNSFEIALVRDHLDDVLRNRLPAIAQELEVEVSRVQEGVEAIARLDPAPGSRFARTDNAFVVPDAVVELDEEGEWVVSIPDSHLPKIAINDSYQQLYEDPEIGDRDRAYLKDRLGSARFLIDAIAQRKRTLLKIATEIVRHQREFLEFGPEHLRPLMRQDIADRIGMHVATVSRAVKDKYIEAPNGTLPLASFFSGGIATQGGGEAESSRAVKIRIAKMIDDEDPGKPFSDQAIADALAEDGLDISRRTVTKYRIAEGIPSTRQRRRFGQG